MSSPADSRDSRVHDIELQRARHVNAARTPLHGYKGLARTDGSECPQRVGDVLGVEALDFLYGLMDHRG